MNGCPWSIDDLPHDVCDECTNDYLSCLRQVCAKDKLQDFLRDFSRYFKDYERVRLEREERARRLRYLSRKKENGFE